jgi:DNA-binding response OmpR family regulator
MMEFSDLYQLTQRRSVLLVEDDEQTLSETKTLFDDLFKEVHTAVDGVDALQAYKDYYQRTGSYFDAVFSDINMPKLNGVDLAKSIRELNPDQAIVIFSAHTESGYLLELINLGIESFVTKPIDLNHLLLSIEKAMMYLEKYSDNAASSNMVELGEGYVWHSDAQTLICHDETVNLTAYESKLLRLLLQKPNRVYTYREILAEVWDDSPDYPKYEENIKYLVTRLRKKLSSKRLVNVYGSGYKIELK